MSDKRKIIIRNACLSKRFAYWVIATIWYIYMAHLFIERKPALISGKGEHWDLELQWSVVCVLVCPFYCPASQEWHWRHVLFTCRIYCRKCSTLSNQKSRCKSKCIRIINIWYRIQSLWQECPCSVHTPGVPGFKFCGRVFAKSRLKKGYYDITTHHYICTKISWNVMYESMDTITRTRVANSGMNSKRRYQYFDPTEHP